MIGPEIVLIGVGLFTFAGGALDWNWFMEHRKARLITSIFGGRTGARFFYIVLGLGVAVVGLLGMLGVINLG